MFLGVLGVFARTYCICEFRLGSLRTSQSQSENTFADSTTFSFLSIQVDILGQIRVLPVRVRSGGIGAGVRTNRHAGEAEAAKDRSLCGLMGDVGAVALACAATRPQSEW